MNIWLLTSEFPPQYGGGISTYCLETAKMFSKFGHHITIITQDYGINQTSETEDSYGYKIVRFNPNKFYTTSFLGHEAHLSYAFAETVKELINKKGSPDVIESQEYMGIAYYLLQYKWLLYPQFKDLKIVITLHAPSFLYLEYNKVSLFQFPYFWIGEMERFCIRAADMVISPSAYLIDAIKDRMKLDDLQISVIKNPYAINWEFSKNKLSKNKIIFFGKLIPQKGCLELIRYFKNLWDGGFNAPLLMIGGGDHLYHPEGIDMIDYIRQQYKTEIKTGKLKLLGSIPPQQINEHLNDAHVIIIPSIVDNLPYTVLEAMGRGKIVLASIQGGQSEVIENGKNGFLFDHQQPNTFKEQLNRILSLSEDSISEVTRNAFFTVQNEYSYEYIYQQKFALLKELSEQKKNSLNFSFIRPIQITEPFENSGEKKLLSIVIPYYNMGKYVEETIISIVKSTYKNIEIIIVNDGSTEKESVDIINQLQQNYSIKIIHKKNEGLSLARNTGAMAAKGEFLSFLDPDDTIENDYYEKAINVLKHYENVYFVGSWAKYFGESKGYWPSFNPEPPYLLVHNMINSSALIYKKNAFLKSGINDPEMIYGMEDYESVINMVKNGYHGVVLPEPLWNYRIRKDSMARAFTREKQFFLYRKIADKHANFYSTFTPQIVHLLNANGSGINYDNPTLTYNLPYSKWISLRLIQFIITKAKSNPWIRKTAVRIKKKYKN